MESLQDIRSNTIDYIGTPLHVAVHLQRCQMVNLLRQMGAEVSSTDSFRLCECGLERCDGILHSIGPTPSQMA
jgi:hypothetical protein